MDGSGIGMSRRQGIGEDHRTTTMGLHAQSVTTGEVGAPIGIVLHIIQITKDGDQSTGTEHRFAWEFDLSGILVVIAKIVMDTKKLTGEVSD